jgi:hypothetical protein
VRIYVLLYNLLAWSVVRSGVLMRERVVPSRCVVKMLHRPVTIYMLHSTFHINDFLIFTIVLFLCVKAVDCSTVSFNVAELYYGFDLV